MTDAEWERMREEREKAIMRCIFATARALSDQIHSDIESLDVPDYIKEAFPDGIR